MRKTIRRQHSRRTHGGRSRVRKHLMKSGRDSPRRMPPENVYIEDYANEQMLAALRDMPEYKRSPLKGERVLSELQYEPGPYRAIESDWDKRTIAFRRRMGRNGLEGI